MADTKVKLYNFSGEKIGEEKLNPSIFNVEVKPKLVQELVLAQQANARQALAHTKGRSEKRGGGKKPWRQKGTGRARHGSIRSPLWAGGGVTFGPTSKRNFSVKVNKKLKKQVLKMVLTDKVKDDKLVLVDAYNLPTAKTKILQTNLDKLPIKDQKVLIVTKTAKDNIILASNNLPKVETIGYNSLNILDILKYKYILISKELIKKVEEIYT